MNQITPFSFEGRRLRTVLIEDEPFFVGKDVADILGYRNGSRDINAHVDEEDKLKYQIGTAGQNRKQLLISESGVYSLIFSSKLPAAKRFKRWVTNEVLPTIRKTGGYQTTQQFQVPQTMAEALQLAADQAKQIEKQKPVVDYYHRQMHNPGLMTTTEIAKEYGKTARWLNKFLDEKGVQYKKGRKSAWVLKQGYSDKGYASYEAWSTKGDSGVHNLLKWTQRGKKFVYDLLAGDGIFPVIELMQIETNG